MRVTTALHSRNIVYSDFKLQYSIGCVHYWIHTKISDILKHLINCTLCGVLIIFSLFSIYCIAFNSNIKHLEF